MFMEGQKPAVLLVDDEENVLKSLNRGLRNEGYQILTAISADKGLEMIAANEIGVIVSDCKMPQKSGEELLKEVREKYPKIYRIMLSGETYTPAEELVGNGLVESFHEKPWDIETLRDSIKKGLETYSARQK